MRIGLAGAHAGIGNFLKRQETVIVRVLNDDLESARRAQAFHRRGGENVDGGFGHSLLELILQLVRDRVAR